MDPTQPKAISAEPSLHFSGVKSLADQNHHSVAAQQAPFQQASLHLPLSTATQHAQDEPAHGQQLLVRQADGAMQPLSAWEQQADESMLPMNPSSTHSDREQPHNVSPPAPHHAAQQPFQPLQPDRPHDLLDHHMEQAQDVAGSPSPHAQDSQPRDASEPAEQLQPSDANGHLEDEARPGGARRRHSSIKSKSWAGSVVWAKLGDFPWWPAQVLDDKDSYIPAGAEPPRRGAVPVRFFGTYEFSYIQSQRALAPFDDPLDSRRTQCEDAEFFLGVREADEFMVTSTLPDGFFQQHEPTPPPLPKARRISKTKSKKAQKNEAVAQAKARIMDELAPPVTATRKERILQTLALKPPAGSPYTSTLCLAGIEGLLAHQNSRPHGDTVDESAAAAAAAGSIPLPPAIAAQAHAHVPAMMQHAHPAGDGGLQAMSRASQGFGAGVQLHGSLSGFGPLMQMPSVQLHAPQGSFMPSQTDASRMQLSGLPLQ